MEEDVEITVCVGSSCHIKGAHKYIEFLQKAIEAYQLEKRVILKACFCMGNCAEGLNVKFDGQQVSFQSLDELKEEFEKQVVARMSA